MKNQYFLPFLMAVFTIVTMQGQTTVSETYNNGDIPTSYMWSDPPGFGDYDATCTGPVTTLSVELPATGGPWEVTGMDIEYKMAAINGAYMSEQRSYIHFQNTGVNEALVYKGTGNTGGIYSYDRPNVDMANGVYPNATELIFEMRAWRTWENFDFQGCNTDVNKVNDGTWTITVYYRAELPCAYPTDLEVSSIAMDEAQISWTDTGSPMEWNIEYGVTGFTPGTGTVVLAPANPHMLTGLTDNTKYDVYVQAACGGTDGNSYWSEGIMFETLFDCSGYTTLEITDTTDGTIVCKGSTVLQAEASGSGDEIYWYDAAVGGNIVGAGEEYTTPFLNSTTSFWASEVVLGGPGVSFGHGIETWDYQWDSSPWNTQGIAFSATNEFTIINVEVFSTSGGGDLTVALLDNVGNVLESTMVTLPAGTVESPIPVTIPLSFTIPGTGQYNLVANAGGPSMKAEFLWPNVGYPFSLGTSGQMTGGYSGGSVWQDAYYFFYNWTIEEGGVHCASPREEVVAIISTDGDEVVNTLPYSATHDSADYGNPFFGPAGAGCGSSENYLNGHNVIYQFTAPEDDVINITLSDLSGYYASVFVYENCAEIGESCLAGAVAGPDDADFGIEEFYVTQGEEYYIVVSTWLFPSIEYTIDIVGFDCATFETPEAETDQNFVAGDTVADLNVEMTLSNFTELIWYEDAAGTTEIPSSTVLVDGETYYVGQIFNGDCEGALLGITVHEIDCSLLEIVSTSGDTVVCRGQMTLEAQSSGTGSNIYWYNAATEGTIVGVGEEFLTPELITTTSFWAAEVYIEGAAESSGHGIETWQNQWSSSAWNDMGVAFTATESFMLMDVEVFSAPWNGVGGGNITIALLNDMQNEIYSTTIALPPGGSESNPIPVTVPLNFMVPSAGGYYLVVRGNEGATPMKAEFEWPNVGYPFSIGDAGVMTGGYSGGSVWQDAYYFLYNWTISTGEVACESDREEVIAVVTSDGDVEIMSIPYTTSDDTAIYGNNFSGTPGSSCGSSGNHLSGDDVVYLYTPPTDDIVTIEIFNVTNNTAGVFVYESCGKIGDECFAGSILGNNETSTAIEDLYLTGGEDYFIVISTSNGNPTNYTLNIYGFECADIEAPVGEETQYFIAGSTIADMTIETDLFNEETIWYDDAGGTNPVPDTTVLNDGDVFYVSQTILGCESGLLVITFYELDCDDLEIVATTDGAVCNSGRALLYAERSGVGSDIYWYDAATGGDIVWVGEEFETLDIMTTTSYWASEVFIQNRTTTGGYGIETWNYQWDLNPWDDMGLAFDVIQPFTLVDVEVFVTGGGGNAVVALKDSAGNIIMTTNVVLPGGGSLSNPVPHTIPLDFQIPPGSYQLVFTSAPSIKYEYMWPNVGYPFSLGTVGEITGGVSGIYLYQDSYYFFYNWTISVGDVECESDRMEAIAEVDTVTPMTPIGDNEQDVCAGLTLADIDVVGDNIRWYDNENLLEEIESSTIVQNGTMYYATQTLIACESNPLAVTVTVIETEKPAGATNQPYVQGNTISDLQVEGENLTWYADINGIEQIPTTTVLEDLHTYYVSQTQNGCESKFLNVTVHQILAIDEALFGELSYYPNPVDAVLTIVNAVPMDSVEVYNLLGQKMISENIGLDTATINLAGLASGTYLLKVNIGEEIVVFHVIKK